MSKKIFSLIHGENIHIGPKAKCIQADDFSTLLSAEEMLKKVKEDASLYIQEVTQESEQIKEQAEKVGFEAGFTQWAEKIHELEKEIQRVHDEVNKIVVPVALQAAKKIVGREMEMNKETVVDIVANNLKAVAQHKKIKIFVNKEDFSILEKEKDKLRQLFEHLESFSLATREGLNRGECEILTEGGIINVRFEDKWKILEEALSSLMNK